MRPHSAVDPVRTADDEVLGLLPGIGQQPGAAVRVRIPERERAAVREGYQRARAVHGLGRLTGARPAGRCEEMIDVELRRGAVRHERREPRRPARLPARTVGIGAARLAARRAHRGHGERRRGAAEVRRGRGVHGELHDVVVGVAVAVQIAAGRDTSGAVAGRLGTEERRRPSGDDDVVRRAEGREGTARVEGLEHRLVHGAVAGDVRRGVARVEHAREVVDHAVGVLTRRQHVGAHVGEDHDAAVGRDATRGALGTRLAAGAGQRHALRDARDAIVDEQVVHAVGVVVDEIGGGRAEEDVAPVAGERRREALGIALDAGGAVARAIVSAHHPIAHVDVEGGVHVG